MISLKHKFIFIHCQKTGGRSIETCLEKYTEYNFKRYNAVQVDTSPVMFKGLGSHIPLSRYYRRWKSEYGVIDDFFKFGCIRNPWERAISFWFWWQKHQAKNVAFSKRNFITKMSRRKVLDCAHFLDINKIDFVIKFERMQKDFDIVCDNIGIPQVQLPHENSTLHKHYTEYYDDEMRDYIGNLWSRDVEYGNYEFGK